MTNPTREEREWLQTLAEKQGKKEEITIEKDVIKKAYKEIINTVGEKTPEELANRGAVASKIIGELLQIQKVVVLLQDNIPKETIRQLKSGMYSVLKLHAAQMLDHIIRYVEYWNYVRTQKQLPGFFQFSLKKYNTQKIKDVLNVLFGEEQRFVEERLKSLDVIYTEHQKTTVELIRR